ncbi:CRISPR-associated helicase/endonuclease Cas3 [Erwinia sp. MMLR14_017]|uniref:CRISPR-associated helicase/endonuclease Cas3 n=1 Tax=Erwinia sp. MMLR14_017 TaxID=3093842 RepID=UPI00298FB987|nr:CRISPR-associated helicase/endonuclease Cas3 [Erwinia sp. MMLR14_017]MDW8844774.1 CRISPR-associated helicase/endonuclease Cas3 [Erwinia sp. MMLR14_017]
MVSQVLEMYRYWGKAVRNEGGTEISCHLLPYHCLDVAAVAAYWWDHAPGIRNRFCQGYSESLYRAWMLFFVALHDFGKWDIRFQSKCWPAWQSLNPNESGAPVKAKWDHGLGGLYWLKKDFDTEEENYFGLIEYASHPKLTWLSWMEAVAGHHGFIQRHENIYYDDSLALFPALKGRGRKDKQARVDWLDALEELFLKPVGLSQNDNPPPGSPLLAGFCSVCDWLGSWCTDETFRYQSKFEPLADYFMQRYAEDAPVVLERSGLNGSINAWKGGQFLLDPGFKPRQLQVLVDELPKEPGLTIVEAPTGSGKTETALGYAWRLLAQGYADSIIFALPSQATANAMLERLEKFATRLFKKPNLILAHGNSRFSHEFAAIKSRGANAQPDEAWAQCCNWLSSSNKRAFLGQIGVCTVDQVLISVLPVKHRFIRSFGISRSVLIVDEVHAYDTYMQSLLEEVLHQQYLAGQSTFLLSATLPSGLKQRLLSTYGSEKTPTPGAEYPQIVWQQQDRQLSFDLSTTPEHLPTPYSLNIDRRYLSDMQPDQELLNEAIAAAKAGAQVCLIFNLVDIAQQVYQQLIGYTDLPVILFHSRYTLKDRTEKERHILDSFSPSGDRSVGRILVATQVVEQSLDVDFDWLITQHCPADLLFQRAGRLHRHSRNSRPATFRKPVLTVILPDKTDYGLSNHIYTNTRAMWRTQQLLERAGSTPLQFPQAYRLWIEEVYQQEIARDEPLWVKDGIEKFECQELLKRNSARMILNESDQASPFRDDDIHIRAVTRDGEMSLPLIPYVETSEGKRLLDGQILERLPELAIPEALALNRVNVPGQWRKRFKLEPDEKGLVWIAGIQREDWWEAGTSKCRLRYSKEVGMAGIPT